MTFIEAQNIFLDFFKDSQVFKTSTVWEKMDNDKGYKWVLVLHNLNYGDSVIIHTKFILKTDLKKENLLKTQFSYLYDLNCVYRFIDFKENLKDKLNEIILDGKFGINVKKLSNFLINPTIRLNKYLYKKQIDCTLFDFTYDPRYSILPCKLINFDFKFDINNVYKVSLNLKKEEKNKFVYRFQLDKKFTEIEVEDLKNIEGVIIQYVKKQIS